MKTSMIAFTAAVLLGLTSTALAIDPFGLRSTYQGLELSANALMRPHTGARTVQPTLFTAYRATLSDPMIRPE
jgi:hypothetical protein